VNISTKGYANTQMKIEQKMHTKPQR